jgi:hypothetical protein
VPDDIEDGLALPMPQPVPIPAPSSAMLEPGPVRNEPIALPGEENEVEEADISSVPQMLEMRPRARLAASQPTGKTDNVSQARPASPELPNMAMDFAFDVADWDEPPTEVREPGPQQPAQSTSQGQGKFL